MTRIAATWLALAGLLCGAVGCSAAAATTPRLLIVASAPVSTEPWIGEAVVQGAQLAAAELNAAGGVRVDGRREPVVIQVEDNAGSAQLAVAIARRAVGEHAAGIVTDGLGATAEAAVTDPASLPVFITFEGGSELVNPARRPTIFRIAPSDAAMSGRLADYLAGKYPPATHPKVAVIADDSTYGQDGERAMLAGFKIDDIPVVSTATVPTGAADLSPQVLAAREAHATLLLVWADASDVADVLVAARGTGWQVPVYTGPTGEDPLVRQRLSAHPGWVNGMTFVAGRITAEVGPAPFAAFRRRFEAMFGPDYVGVRQDGKRVVQPPDWAQYAFDSVNLIAAAVKGAGAVGPAEMAQLNDGVTITGANGDERGFGVGQREGVSPDDMYFATFHDFVFEPVSDDILSTGLPDVPQLYP